MATVAIGTRRNSGFVAFIDPQCSVALRFVLRKAFVIPLLLLFVISVRMSSVRFWWHANLFPSRFEQIRLPTALANDRGRLNSSRTPVVGLEMFRPSRLPPSRYFSLGEYYAVHSKVCFSYSGAFYASITNEDTVKRRCVSWKRKALAWKECEAFSASAERASNEVEFSRLYRVAGLTMRAPPRAAKWHDMGLLLVILNPRDWNIYHITARLLLAHSYVLRARAGLLGANALFPRAVLLLTPWRLKAKINPKVARRSNPRDVPFHAGLAQALFEKQGITVLTTGKISDVLRSDPRKHSMLARFFRGSFDTHCFESVVSAGSFANRFSFPDSYFSLPNVSSKHTSVSDRFSSELRAVQNAVFAPRARPRMRNKLVYIARQVGSRRAFVQSTETRLRSTLRRVCDEVGAEFVVAESGVNSANLARARSFQEQVDDVANASVVFGLHGAGLTLGIFMPPRISCLIELFPPSKSLVIFRNIAIGLNLGYDDIRIRKKQWHREHYLGLSALDLVNIESVVRSRLVQGRRRIASGNA